MIWSRGCSCRSRVRAWPLSPSDLRHRSAANLRCKPPRHSCARRLQPSGCGSSFLHTQIAAWVSSCRSIRLDRVREELRQTLAHLVIRLGKTRICHVHLAQRYVHFVTARIEPPVDMQPVLFSQRFYFTILRTFACEH